MLVVPRLWGQCAAVSREAHRILRHTLKYVVRMRLTLTPAGDNLQPPPNIHPHNLPCDDVRPIFMDDNGQPTTYAVCERCFVAVTRGTLICRGPHGSVYYAPTADLSDSEDESVHKLSEALHENIPHLPV